MMCSTSRSGNIKSLTVVVYVICFINSLHSVISEEENFTHLIGGIFSSLTSAPYLAAEMSLNDYNSKADGLPIFQQIFLEVDCGDESTLKEAMISNSDVRIWLAGCQQDCLTLAEIAHLHNRTDIIILCYGITGLPFEESQQYNNLFSIESNPYSIAQTYADFIVHCDWDNIAVIYQHEENNDKYTKIAEFLIGVLQIDSDKELSYLKIEDDTLGVFEYLEKANATIIVSLCDAATARRILCNSYTRKLYGGKYIWMFPGSYEHEWYKPLDYEDLGCSIETMQEVAYGHFTAKSLNWNEDANRKTLGRSTADFQRQLLRDLERVGGHYTRSDIEEAALVYDAIWASVFGIIRGKQSESLDEHSSSSNHIDLSSAMKNLSFIGISGDFSINSNSRRSMSNSVVQMEIYMNKKYEPFAQHIFKSNQWNYHENFGGSCLSIMYELPTATTTTTPKLSSDPPSASSSPLSHSANKIGCVLVLIYIGSSMFNVV